MCAATSIPFGHAAVVVAFSLIAGPPGLTVSSTQPVLVATQGAGYL